MADLMKKTKKELVDIILRKDDVEKESAKRIKELSNELIDVNEAYSAMRDKCNTLIDECDVEKYQSLADDVESYQKEIDEMTTTIHSYKSIVNVIKCINLVLLLWALIATLLWVIK